jgi:hypothetical protein
MVNSKRKGYQWEHDLVKELNDMFPDSSWKRIAMSGAMGTIMNEPLLKADGVGRMPFMEERFAGECKVGYGGFQMKVDKGWFDKIRMQADESYSIPLVFLKFSGARSGVQHVVAMDMQAFEYLMNELKYAVEENAKLIREVTCLRGESSQTS